MNCFFLLKKTLKIYSLNTDIHIYIYSLNISIAILFSCFLNYFVSLSIIHNKILEILVWSYILLFHLFNPVAQGDKPLKPKTQMHLALYDHH